MFGSLLNFFLSLPAKFLGLVGVSLGRVALSIFVLFALYCVWCLWLGPKLTYEAETLWVKAKAESIVFDSWLQGILVRLHFRKSELTLRQASKIVASVSLAPAK